MSENEPAIYSKGGGHGPWPQASVVDMVRP